MSCSIVLPLSCTAKITSSLASAELYRCVVLLAQVLLLPLLLFCHLAYLVGGHCHHVVHVIPRHSERLGAGCSHRRPVSKQTHLHHRFSGRGRRSVQAAENDRFTHDTGPCCCHLALL